ncbi:ABC transporter substrate-binding protein [Paenibacillus sp. N4]|uniref:ABC transporter substrate-binding protein n=1 Tax=Paenibacillus vietnamensis TaxID=2590547 RepID=UPI001CD1656D|nr:ABC transporter substrate-binding protein [Paenibacillus vietnamensis]MCA0755796.1 ABC transporter substrate-binding protein [Paenibacillus vietnamensis]
MNKKIILLGALITAFMIGGCSSGSGNAGTGNESSGGQASKGTKTISMIGWYEEGIMNDAITKINESLDGYKLEYTFVNLKQYNNVLSTQLAAGEGPDIVMDGASFPARIKAGNLIDISNEAYVADFNEAGLALSTSANGKVYGIPAYGWYSGVWYNKEIFAKYNLTPPQTFDELLAVSQTLTDNGVQPLGFGLSDSDTAWHSLIGYLENAYYNGGKATTAFDTQFAKGETTLSGHLNSYVDEWAQLIDKGFINEKMLGISGEQVIPEFISGEIAMFNGGPWQYTQLKESGMEFGMFSHVGNDKDNRWLVGGPAANFGINKNSENMEGAKAALKLFGSKEVQQSILKSNPGGFSYFKGLDSELPEEYSAIKEILEAGRVGVSWDRWGTNMPAQSLIDEGLKQLQGMVAGMTTTEQFLKAMDDKANLIRYKD